ncbi:hypothetical protein ACFQJ7_14085 [Halovenus rubra]|uniref:Uncharacterized protein n=2 Tax=Halovenus rubra TaxID=869890 RepID=A0ACC7DY35_9EURY|nr:hypothetical protein [Halovenus rubra]
MYWDSEAVEEVVIYPNEVPAQDISSPIEFVAKTDVEHTEQRRRERQRFLSKSYDYVPVRPYDLREYLDVADDTVNQVDRAQHVSYESTVLRCLNVLTEYPFVIVTHPDTACYRFMTLADLNSRVAKQRLYPYFAKVANSVSRFLESEFGSAELAEVYADNRNTTRAIKRWREEQDANTELHLSEFMNLTDLKVVVTNISRLRTGLGFTSKNSCRDCFDSIARYRNNVMHANRSLVHQTEDATALAAAIERATKLAADCNALLDE